MKETTRQLILLFGVLTLLTSSVVVINMADTGASEEPEEVNETGVNESYNATEPDTLIGKSIRGYQIMVEDMKKAMGLASDTPDRP
jgi:hypothetical protein